ncbi:probable aminopeptidase NPEPL1, partial [Hyposmocoma kahamanoa]|uniref:probable aminopeptidase NPEPL1 n=1 Tax=Hyposmocoma kahamanoa TaxID=1477025 RepID=UPI000E6D7136
MSNASVSLKFQSGLSPSDPEEHPVFIVGQAPHLSTLSWSDIRCKLEPRVTEEAWKRGLNLVTSNAGESCEIWARAASLASLPARRSRHAAPSRSHALAKLVSARAARNYDEFIVLVCRKRDLLACTVAIARSFPLYHARSGPSPLGGGTKSPPTRNVTVEIQLVKEDKADGESEDEGIGPLDPRLTDNSLSPEELATIQQTADYTRLAAKIADTPCNIMNVDTFIETAIQVAKDLDIQSPVVIRGEELKERGFGGIYGVGKAAEVPPALVSLSYCPPGATESVAWVGKGIVYDTGGLSIKTKTGMVGMKGDCA